MRFTHSELKIKICYTDSKGYFIIGSRKAFRARFLRQNSDVPILSHKMTILKVNLFLKDKHQFKAWNLYFIMITYRLLKN